MWKKGCCSAIKRSPSDESREKKNKRTRKSKRYFWKSKSQESNSVQTAVVNPAPPSPPQEVKLIEAENHEQTQAKHAYSIAVATAVAAEAAVAAAQAAAEVVRLTAAARTPTKSRDEISVLKIQAAFRRHMAKRQLRALKGLTRIKTMVRGQSVKYEATTTLHCMQTMARVQAQTRDRRVRISEENQALRKQLLLKHEKTLEKFRNSIGEDWDDSTQTKEQAEAKMQSRQEAALRRERALAYAYSHQQTWRNSPKSASHTVGWSWLEKWMAARPWENGNAIEKEFISETNSAKSARTSLQSPRGLDLNKPSPTAKKQTRARTPSRLSVSTPPRTKTPPSAKVKPESPRKSTCSVEEDAKSITSVQSERYRRKSVTGGESTVGDDESVTSSPGVPSYMAATKSAKAKSRMSTSSAIEKEAVTIAKKRLSVSSSPSGQRRQSRVHADKDAGMSSQGSN